MIIKPGAKAFLTLFLAIIFLIALSFINWSDITKSVSDSGKESSFLKDFNLISQLLPEDTTVTDGDVDIDPALKAAMEAEANKPKYIERIDSTTGAHIVDTAIIDIKPDPTDFDGLSAMPRDFEGVDISILIRPLREEGSYKLSIRTGENVNACEIATALGGGGHIRAAGCEVIGSIETVKKAILKEVEIALCQ